MSALTRLWAALSALTTNLTDLASTIAETNTALRGRLGLDGADELVRVPVFAAPELEQPAATEPAKGRGRKAKS